MNEQTMMDSRELLTAMQFLPVEERLKLQGVIAGMRLALSMSASSGSSQQAVDRPGV